MNIEYIFPMVQQICDFYFGKWKPKPGVLSERIVKEGKKNKTVKPIHRNQQL